MGGTSPYKNAPMSGRCKMKQFARSAGLYHLSHRKVGLPTEEQHFVFVIFSEYIYTTLTLVFCDCLLPATLVLLPGKGRG